MNYLNALTLPILFVALLVGGCAMPSGSRSVNNQATQSAKTNRLSDLNIGYSVLYETLGKQQNMEKMLWVKFESDAAERIVKTITAAAGDAQKQLTTLAARWPEIKLKSDIPVSAFEAEVRRSMQQERTKTLLREKGKDFERLLLFSESGVLNQERHMVRALQKLDPEKQRQAILEGIGQKLDGTYRALQEFMHERYFSK